MRIILPFIALLLPLSVVAQDNIIVQSPVTPSPGFHNTTLGIGTALNLIYSSDNVNVGYNAGYSLSGGSYNVFVGSRAGYSSVGATGNVFLGNVAGQKNTSGSGNTFLGSAAGSNNTTATGNVFIGEAAGQYNTTASDNVFVGTGAGGANTIGVANTFVGYNAGRYSQKAESNTFLGYRAGQKNSTGSGNTFLGTDAGLNSQTGFANVFIGVTAGYNNTSGSANLFLGQRAGFNNSTGAYNTFIGSASGENNSVGANNNFIGNGAGLANTEGNFNVFIGSEAGSKNKRGGSNVQIGSYAGKENLEGSANTFIGHNANVPSGASLNNVTVLGYNALATTSNSVILGSGANVGIGTSAPSNKLHIATGAANSSGLRLENLTSSSPASVMGQYKFLTVDEAGNVIMGSLNSSMREGAAESFWQRNGSFLQSTQNDGVIIGTKVSKTPTGYKLFVEEGILTEKVKVAVKNTNDWSDYVFKPNYKLQSLTQVEQYIQQHEHLPGVPSAKEMVKWGNDLHKTDAKLLEKIEELTLYSIQLEKQLQANDKKHQAEIDELKQLMKQVLKKK